MLRTRLFLNLLPFVVILLAVGSYAVILYSQLARDVEIRVAESYGSLQAAQEMSLALAGMESDVWLATTRSESNRVTFATNQQRFEQNLAAQLKSESLAGAKELNEQVGADYQAFRLALARLHSSTNAVRRGIYQQAVVPAALKLHASLKKIRDLNHEIILGTSGEIQAITREVMRLMILGLAIALIVSAYACYRLSRSILQPIQSLTQATRKLGEGEWEHPVPVNSRDELSELATAFNKMAAQLQEYRQSSSLWVLFSFRSHGLRAPLPQRQHRSPDSLQRPTVGAVPRARAPTSKRRRSRLRCAPSVGRNIISASPRVNRGTVLW
jgi:HAMP domain-containing protein